MTPTNRGQETEYGEKMRSGLGGLLLVALLMPSISDSASSAPAGDRKNARESLASVRAANDGDEKVKAYLKVDEESVMDDSDVRVLYDEFANLEKELKGKDSGRVERVAEHLAKVLASCQDPKHRAVIKELVEKESASLGPGYWGPWAVKSEAELLRETPRYARLRAVLEAAGKGQNEDALPALRSMRKKGGQAGKMAETAIGRIGKDEDLETFINEIKSDDGSMTSLYGFGRKGTSRVIRELNDPQVSDKEKLRLAGSLPKAVSKEDLPELVALLKHPNRGVVEVVGGIVGGSLQPNDEALLRELLKHPNPAIRGPAVRAIDRLWNERFLPVALERLKNDPDAGNRSFLAHMLGNRRIRAAEVALREVASGDTVPWVREAAQEALRSLSQ